MVARLLWEQDVERLLSRFEIKRGPSFFGYWHLKGLVLIMHHGRVGLRAEGAKR